MAKEPDYYSILGVDKDAPEREIKRAYYKLARELHPDRAKSQEEARTNSERLALISKAYNVLKDPQKREHYNAGRTPKTVTGEAKQSPKTAPPAPAADPVTEKHPSPATGESRTGLPKIDISANDIQQQKVITAQKAFVKGMQFYKMSEFRKALPFFEVAVQNDPEGEPQYHLKLAQTLIAANSSFTRAVQEAEIACQMDTYNIEFKLILAGIYEQVGIQSKAKEVYEDVLRWDENNTRAKRKLAEMQQVAHGKKSLLEKLFPSFFKK